MEGVVGGVLAGYLEANRAELNDRVAAYRREAPDFDPQTFSAAVRELIAPVVDAVEARGDGFAGQVAGTLVDVALGLCADRRLVGAIRDGWSVLLPALAVQLSAAPQRVVASVSNALATLERDGRAAEWIERMVALAAVCPDVDELLAAGQVAAWRCGMAAYREPALALAAGLSPQAVSVAIGAAPPTPSGDLAEASRLTAPVRVGAFRGYGGVFLRPPTVRSDGPRVLATDGDGTWELFADAFGTAVVRVSVTPGPVAAAPPDTLKDVAELTSWTDSPAGLVATSALSHAVLFTGIRA